ncbi:Lrp/AsnC family transcriptional regulator [Salipiger aestuarii]|uniref:Lrp/AsnC family transcriptional regulator n=1 Tax=Salipiger aestuarii TaxID=568098 RepID=UPI001CC293E3|nr:Lrp/AsnC family transcriptional regulator [Salipiger aestuarii]
MKPSPMAGKVHDMELDRFDRAILVALQADATVSNTALAETVHLSASQISRRRAALESAQVILGYTARLNAGKLGFGLRAITRVNLRSHGQGGDADFARFVAGRPEICAAFSVSGDADYVLDIRVRDPDAYAAFIHDHLLPHPQVGQVRSELVLKTLKDRGGVTL